MNQKTEKTPTRDSSVSASRLVQALIKREIITEEILHDALDIRSREPRKEKRKITDILIDEFDVDRDKIYDEIIRLYGFQKISLRKESVDKGRLDFIKDIIYNLPESVSNQFLEKRILPFKWHEYKRNVLVLVTSDPTDHEVETLAKHLDTADVEIAYASLDEIEALIQEVFYANNEFLQKIFEEAQEVEILDDDARKIDEDALDNEINQSRLTNLVEGMLVEAVRKGASDIHVIPRQGNITDIYFRFDGKLQQWYSQADIKPEAVIAVLKDRSLNVDRFERSTTQDGYMQRKIDGYYIRFRVSVIPIVGVEFDRRLESVVIRVLDDRKVITDLAKIGLQEQARTDFEKAITQPQGMVILTGPTGSGKSTTLVAALSTVMDSSKNVLTVEEPVEYLIHGARQIKLGPKLNFDSALRSILRHDPDIVMVGEIRDLKSAEIAISLANTGHLTFSTLHTNDAPSAISRLYMLGVEPFLIANAINLVMAQRLVRRLCNHCKKINENPDPDRLLRLGFTKEEITETTFYDPVGCKQCFEGYKGRIAISEALLFSKEIRQAILHAANDIDEETLREIGKKNGMLSLRASGRERIKDGLTTMQEIIAATSET
ncbi:MAG: GspE/PulE family protein [bacterium]